MNDVYSLIRPLDWLLYVYFIVTWEMHLEYVDKRPGLW